MMLSTAEGSMRSTSETNGILNNNTVDAIKLNEPTSVSVASILETSDETAAQKLMAQTEVVAVDPALLDSSADRCAASESSTKVTGTWCPPIQTATNLSDINGKKVVKPPAKDDPAQTERKDSESARLAERVVRAPCVKLEPQESSLANSSKLTNLLPLMACTNDGLQFMKIKPEPPNSVAAESSNTVSQPEETNEKLPVSSNASTSQKLPLICDSAGVNSTCSSKSHDSESSKNTNANSILLPINPTIAQTSTLTSSESITSSVANKEELDLSKSIASSPSNQTRRPCNCTRSSCLKLYCECFAQGITCNGCNCTNCHNNGEHVEERNRAIKLILDRNPCAFQSKIRKQYGHVKGCNCKKSNCLKNYCECYEAKIPCTSLCRCYGCQNSDLSAAPSQVSLDFLKKSVIMPKPESQHDSGITSVPSPSTVASSAADYPMDSLTLSTSAKLQIAARLSAKIENDGNGEVQLHLSQTPPVKKRVPQNRRPRTSCPANAGRSIAPSSAATPSAASPSLPPALAPSPALPSSAASVSLAVTLASTPAALTGAHPSPSAVYSAATPPATSGITPPECPALVPAPSKVAAAAAADASSAKDSLTETINEVVAAARNSVTGSVPRSKSNARRATEPSASNPKRARVSFVADGSSVYSPDSTCLTLPVVEGDDVSSETSAGPREDEFTAEELAMMQRIRQRAVHSTDASTIASNSTTVNDGANIGSPAPPGDESPLTLEPCPNGVLETPDARQDADTGAIGAIGIDLPVSSETSTHLQTTSAAEDNSASGGGGGGVTVDPETPKNILSFLQTSQQQIESALGAGVSPVTLTTATGGPTNLLYTILSTNSASTGSPQAIIPIATKTANSTAAVVGAMSFRPCVHNASSGVVHWRPQQQQQQQQAGITSPLLQQPTTATLVAATSGGVASEQQSVPLKVTIAPRSSAPPSATPPPTPSNSQHAANGERSATTLSQLTDLVSGENGLRAQVLSLQRQVSAMQRSQMRQTRLLAAIHRTLMRRQPSYSDAVRRRHQLRRFAAKARSTALERAKKRKKGNQKAEETL